jgi:hypothetical protein
MMRTLPLAIVLVITVLTIALLYPRASAEAAKPIDPASEQAACVEPAETFDGKTAEQWRAEGPEGLAELIEAMKPQIDQYRSEYFRLGSENNPEVAAKNDAIESNMQLLDQVAQQRDAYAAGLYWYTDLDEAIQEAQRTGKPILSLRMLGKLCEEYSCANSRFFRTVLYADASVGKMLREQFVVHWKSVRPVPVITIDMGDGRTIKRTITGNSAHYVLDPNGRVVDCLPGLYGPNTFKRLAEPLGEFAKGLTEIDDKLFAQHVGSWHTGQAERLDRAWIAYMRALDEQGKIPVKPQVNIQALNNADTKPVVMPDAFQAGRVAIAGKFRVEAPLLKALLPDAPTPQEAADDTALWEHVAKAYADESKLDEASIALMRKKTIPAEEAFKMTLSKTVVEDPLLRMVKNFEGGIAIETARNEHLLHRELHKWFAQAQAPLDLDKLNSRVYAKLFLTPEEDPWIGLVPADTYSALDHGGLLK